VTVDVQSGLSPTRTVLANRATLLAKETRKTPIVAINVAVRAGSAFDPPDAPGATHLLTRVIDRGTAHRTAAQIADELDSRGVTLGIGASRHLFSLGCTCLAEDFEPVLTLIGEIVSEPTIPEVELATRKGEVVTAIRQDEDNPAVRAVETLMAALYGADHPYGRRTKGTLDSIEALTRERLLALHRRQFAPSETSVVVVGDVDADRAVDVASRIFGGWQAAAPAAPDWPGAGQAAARRRIVVPMMNKAQADVAYGFVTITRDDPSYYACWLMNNALGQYALGGRLGDSIRERQGMAYYVSSVLDANLSQGPLVIRAGVSPANVDRAIASIDEELERLRRDGLSARELNESRQYLIGSMPRALETNGGIAQFLQTAEFFGLGLDYDVRLPALLSAVSLDQANDAARLLDPAQAAIVVAGPYQ
jgi:zinc protease